MSTEYTVGLKEQISGPAEKATAAVRVLRAEVRGLQADLAKVRGSVGTVNIGGGRLGGGSGSSGLSRTRGSGRQVADEWQRMAAAAERATAREAAATERAALRGQKARDRAGAAQMRQVERDHARRERLRERENNAILRDVAKQAAAAERAAARIRSANESAMARRSSARRSLGMDAASGLMGMAGGGLKAGIAAAYAGTAYVGKELFDSAALRQTSQRRFTAMLGDPKLARAEVTDAFKIAEKTEFDPRQVLEATAQLSNNFKDRGSRRYILGSVADFAGVTGNGNEGFERSVRAINQIASKGKLQQEELTGQLGEIGLNTGDVYKQLAPMLGIKDKDEQKVRDRVIKAITAGKVTGNMGVQAITNSMRNMAGGGPAGSYAAKASDTITGQMSNIKGGMSTLFGVADVGNWDALSSVKGILAGIGNIFNSDSAAGAGLVKTIRGLTDAFMPLLTEIQSDIAKFSGELETADGKGSMFAKGLATVALRAYQVAKAVAWVTGAFFSLYGAVVMGDEKLAEWSSQAYQFATNFVDGLVGGIKAGVVRVWDAASELAAAARDAIKDKLHIHSPSRVAFELGGNTAAGFAGGLGAGMKELEVPQLRLGGLQLAGGGLGGGGSLTVNVAVDAPGGAQQDFAKLVAGLVAAEVRPQMEIFFGHLQQEGA